MPVKGGGLYLLFVLAGVIGGVDGAVLGGHTRLQQGAFVLSPKGRFPAVSSTCWSTPALFAPAARWAQSGNVHSVRRSRERLYASLAPPEAPIEEETTKAVIPQVEIKAPEPPRVALEDAAALFTNLTWPPANPTQMKQWVNLGILAILGISAACVLVTVDMDVWRGWTWQEILLRIPYDNWNAYEGGLMTHPILTKTIINIVIYLISDWMSQVEWGRSGNVLEFDLARTARNGLIGAFFGPLVHWYYEWSDIVLPMDVPINRIFKIIMDQSIYFVSKCSVYIALVGLLRGDSGEEIVTDVKTRLWPIVTRGWRFWPLAHIVTYGVIPPRHRVLWVNCLDILWGSILASLAGAKKNGAAEASVPPPPPPPVPQPVVVAAGNRTMEA